MKFELPTWAYAAVASAGILAGSAYLATRPQEAAPAELPAATPPGRYFPDARPAPPGLAELAQRQFDAKKYAAAVPLERHGDQYCTDKDGRQLKDCATQCPDEPDLFGRMDIDDKSYYFSTRQGRVLNLTLDKPAGTSHDVYFWGHPDKDTLTRDGPYKYDHGRKMWQKVQPWWPARKNQ